MPTEPPEDPLALARSPDEVPTPLAIAVADFCRRAGRQPTAEAVRRALARLSAEDDQPLRALVEADPPARPLGPDAVVDLFLGLSPAEAAEREENGYYLALECAERPVLAPERAQQRSAATHERREAQRQRILAALADSRGDLEKAAARLELSPDELNRALKRLSLVRRAQSLVREGTASVQPQVRRAGTKTPKVRPSAPVPPPLPKRGAARPPRGRLVLGAPSLRDWRELQQPSGKAELLDLLRSYKGNRHQLRARLQQVFKVPGGTLELSQLDALIARHGLAAEAEKLEHDNLRFLFGQARGELAAVAKRFKHSPAELRAALQARGWWDEIDRLRDRYRREVLGRSLAERVRTLLQRPAYLRDLRALEPMERQLREDVERVWPSARAAPERERARALAERLGLEEPAAAALIARFELD